MACLPSLAATAIVVPEPAKGSNTTAGIRSTFPQPQPGLQFVNAGAARRQGAPQSGQQPLLEATLCDVGLARLDAQ